MGFTHLRTLLLLILVPGQILAQLPAAGAGLMEQISRDLSALDRPAPVVLTYAEIVEKVRSSVVTVEVEAEGPAQPEESASEQPNFDLRALPSPDREADKDDDDVGRGAGGSGIILTASGLILTNYHVVAHAAGLRIRLRGEEQGHAAVVVGKDPGTDVALLRVTEGVKWQAAVCGDSSKARAGDVVLAMGSPFGLEQTVTLGVVSATGRDRVGLIQMGLEDFIQTDAAINPGNSGGPLIDAKGRVIGMNTGRYWGESIGFAVPMNMALKVAADLLQSGTVIRGQLGARCVELTSSLAATLEVPRRTRGAVVADIQAEGAAAKAGLLPGDVIVRINELRVDGRARLFMALAATKPGDQAAVHILRGKEARQLTVQLSAPPPMPPPAAAPGLWQAVPGLKLGDLTPAVRDRFFILPEVSGIAVLEVFAVLGTDEILSAGEVVTTINGIRVSELAEAQAALDRSKAESMMLSVARKGGEIFVSVPRPAAADLPATE